MQQQAKRLQEALDAALTLVGAAEREDGKSYKRVRDKVLDALIELSEANDGPVPRGELKDW